MGLIMNEAGNRFFERQILFGIGRHFWNIVGIFGVVAMTTGAIFFATSTTYEEKSKKDWLLVEHPQSQAAREFEAAEPLHEKYKSECDAARKGNWGLMDSCGALRRSTEHVENSFAPYKDQYEAYKKELKESNAEATARLIAAPPLLLGGLGVVAVVSIVAAVLAIERNTRREESKD